MITNLSSKELISFENKVADAFNSGKIKAPVHLYSNNEADIYETSLMRRLAGLLYIDNKIMGDIKEEIKKENS